MKRFVLPFVLLLSSVASAQNVNWKPIAGPPVAPSVERRTPLGVRYVMTFSLPSLKYVDKQIKWMRKRGVPESLIEEYRRYVLLLRDPDEIPLAIDVAYGETQTKHRECGGPWRLAATRIKPGDILVKVEAVPVWSPEWNTYAAGFAWGGRNLIQAVGVSANGLMNNPTRAGPLRTFHALVKYEMGNYFSFKAGHRIKTLADEIGDAIPCSRAKTGRQSSAIRL